MEVNGKYYTITELEKIVNNYEKSTTSFLGNKDIEYYTFITMSLEDLRELVQVNQYLKGIISTDKFWCQYLLEHYGVNYKTECLHIGQVLLKNKLSATKFYNKVIKQQDIAVVKFLLDTKQITIGYDDLRNITYLPLIKLLIPYIDEQQYNRQDVKQLAIKDIIHERNINVIAQLLEHDRIPIKMIKQLLKFHMDKKIHDLLFDYYNVAKLIIPDEFSESSSSTNSSESSSSDSDSDDEPRRRNRSPVKPRRRNRSPVKRAYSNKKRTKSPVKPATKTARNKSPAKSTKTTRRKSPVKQPRKK